MDKRVVKFPINLFCSLMLLSFIPFLYTLVRTNICIMFGFGMVVHLACSVGCYIIYKRRLGGKMV